MFGFPKHSPCRSTSSKRVAAYEAAYLTHPECSVTEIRACMSTDAKQQAIGKMMLDAIARMPRLATLSLSSLSVAMLPAVAAAMRGVGPRLKSLALEDLSEMPVHGDLFAALEHLTALERLELDFGSNSQLSQQDIDALGVALCQKMTKLRNLSLTIESTDHVVDSAALAGILSCHIQSVTLAGDFFCKRFFAAAQRETSKLEQLRVSG